MLFTGYGAAGSRRRESMPGLRRAEVQGLPAAVRREVGVTEVDRREGRQEGHGEVEQALVDGNPAVEIPGK